MTEPNNSIIQARRKRCGMVAVATPKICKGERERKWREGRKEREKRRKKREREEKRERKGETRKEGGLKKVKKAGREEEETEKAGENMVTEDRLRCANIGSLFYSSIKPYLS